MMAMSILSNAFAGRAAVVTGGLGFIGSHLVRALVRLGAHVTAVDNLTPEGGGNLVNIRDVRDQITVRLEDVCDPSVVATRFEGVDYLFHLAALTSHVGSMADPLRDFDVNGRAVLSILEACRRVNPRIRVVFTSTRQVYGRPQYLPVNEDHPLRPVDVNGVSKLAAETLHRLYGEVYGIWYCILRPTNTYGPGMRIRDAKQMFLGDWIRRLLTGETIEIYGDGAQVRDFTHVSDAVDALLRVATAGDAANGHVYNLGASPPISLKDLAELLIRTNGGGAYRFCEYPAERRALEIGSYYSDYGRISRMVEWEPRLSLPSGLAETLAFFREHLSVYL